MKFKIINSTNEVELGNLLEVASVTYKIIDIRYSMIPLLGNGNSTGILYSALIEYEE